jgi:hypothetical protein
VVGALSDEAGPAPSSVSQKAANHQRAATAVAVAPRPEMNAQIELPCPPARGEELAPAGMATNRARASASGSGPLVGEMDLFRKKKKERWA